MATTAQVYLLPPESDSTIEEDTSYLQLTPEELSVLIRDEFRVHLEAIRPNGSSDTGQLSLVRKEAIRAYHATQREEVRTCESKFVRRYGQELVRRHFASGKDVVPEQVQPELCLVTPDSEEGRLFRLATLLWSVPVSRGYGRRMRFIVRDRANSKLMGIFALGDPVFNIRARDRWIGWTSEDRMKRLVNVMDAYVVGAVPPYSQLLGAKLVASLATSQEVCDTFERRYSGTRGIISDEEKHAQLVLITVTSALGRSALYNRLRLTGLVEFQRIGMTEGWGHFQVSRGLFLKMRRLLEIREHPYASGYHYTQGPNWRMRVVRQALTEVGLNPNLLRHGVAREVYAAPLAPQWREFLLGRIGECVPVRPSASEIGNRAVSRWLVPRAERRPDYRSWTTEDTWNTLTGQGASTP